MAGMMSWMLLWGLVGLALLVAIVVGAVWLVRRGLEPPAPDESPEAILRRRFAAGEIDEDEFFRRQAGLKE